VWDELRVPIVNEVDVVEARRSGRQLAAELGFGLSDQALIATAISELARNILQYAKRGELIIGIAHNGGRKGIDVVALDHGPGIPDPEKAMRDGYSTGSGLGLGLPGTRRIMDEFELDTEVGRGTRVAVKKWAP
jgi:serine/threonine-protein kinase RsbT